MRTLKIGIISTFLLWIIFSIYCKTFDPLCYSDEAGFTFCSFLGIAWIMALITPEIMGDKN